MKTIKYQNYKTELKRRCLNKALSIEEEIRKSMLEKTPIEANEPMIYTELKEGVLPQCDPRTDKWDIAMTAKNKYDANQALETPENPVNNEQKTENHE